MDRLAAAQGANQRGDIRGKRGFVVKAIARNLARSVAPQVRRHRAVAGCGQCRNLVAPGLRGVGKTMQQQDERAGALLDIGKVESVGA